MDFKGLMLVLEANKHLFDVSWRRNIYSASGGVLLGTIGCALFGWPGLLLGVPGYLLRFRVKNEYEWLISKSLSTKEQARLVGMVEGKLECTDIVKISELLKTSSGEKKILAALKMFRRSL